jgi:ATP-dependent DNA helicase RecG
MNVFTKLESLYKKSIKLYSDLGISSYWELLMFIPKYYINYHDIIKIAELSHGSNSVCIGKIKKVSLLGNYRKYLQVCVEDKSGILNLIFFHKVQYYKKILIVDSDIKVYGAVKISNFGIKSMIHPQIIFNNSLNVRDDVEQTLMNPIYKTVKGISSDKINALVLEVLEKIEKQELYLSEPLSQNILKQYNFMALSNAFRLIHNLSHDNYRQGLHDKAIARIKLDELITYQLLMLSSNRFKSFKINTDTKLLNDLLQQLPYKLTSGQLKAIDDILSDLIRGDDKQMNRLLQGDVGCGKTIVAFIISILVIKAGKQVCLMAPTQLLANQHYNNFMKLFASLNLTVTLITSKKSKQDLSAVANGDANLIIGTHALIYELVQFKELGLSIIDEQHRFGVKQRYSLLEKGKHKGRYPHLLMMSATPIPRSQALHLYADLEFSTINTMPKGRKTTNTVLMNVKRKQELAKFVSHHIELGTQAYWVCPLIDKSADESMNNILDLNTVHQWLQEYLPSARVIILHGAMKTEEKDAIMQDFIDKKFDILLTTTVIETGVDVKNANIMVLEHADRFGLASIHQLRGRVGRAGDQGYCVLLFADDVSYNAKHRLNVLHKTADGFEIAEEDLKMRGHGELVGERQSGSINFKYASVPDDNQLLITARNIANELLENQPDVANWYLNYWANIQY